MRTFALIFALFTTACTVPPTSHETAAARMERKRFWDYEARMGDTDEAIFRTASRIDPHKPIGEYEAFVLSSAYFYAIFGACGGVERVSERGPVWVAGGAIGYAGSDAPPIFVDKTTGATWSKGQEKIATPRSFLKFVKKQSNQAMQLTTGSSGRTLSMISARHSRPFAVPPVVADLASR